MDFREGIASLRKLGLSEPEARTLAALHELGPSTAERLAKFTGIHRRSVYDALAILMNEGLCAQAFVGGQKRFSASGIPLLLSWVEENRAKAADFLTGELRKKTGEAIKPIVRVFVGVKAVKAVWMETLEPKTTICWYAGAMQGARGVHKEFYPIWDAKRIRLKIPVRFIFFDLPEVRPFIANEPHFEAKSIPAESYTNAPLWLYGNKVALVFWREEPLAIVIEDADLAKTYRNFFEAAWKSAKPEIKNR